MRKSWHNEALFQNTNQVIAASPKIITDNIEPFYITAIEIL